MNEDQVPGASFDYAHQKFQDAVDGMATGIGSLQDRLFNAFLSHLHIVIPGDLPDDLQREFDRLMAQATSAEDLSGRGTFDATFSTMDDETAREMAEAVVALAHRVRRAAADVESR